MNRFGARLRGTTPVSQWLGGQSSARVKLVQRGTVSIASGNTSNTATLPVAVVMANSRLTYLGCTFATNDIAWDSATARLTFTNSNTITATRVGSAGAGAIVVGFEVVEYHQGAIKSVQRDTVTTAGTKAISSVDTTKSQLDFLGWSCTDATTASNQVVETPRISLASATSVAAANGNGDANSVVSFQVVEWN